MTTLWWQSSLAVMLGGGLGSLARFWLTHWASARFPHALGAELGILGVNILGSFIIGALAMVALSLPTTQFPLIWRQFLMVGVLGGLTTFSTFSLQSMELFRTGRPELALGNIALSVGCCLAAVWLGTSTIRMFLRV